MESRPLTTVVSLPFFIAATEPVSPIHIWAVLVPKHVPPPVPDSEINISPFGPQVMLRGLLSPWATIWTAGRGEAAAADHADVPIATPPIIDAATATPVINLAILDLKLLTFLLLQFVFRPFFE